MASNAVWCLCLTAGFIVNAGYSAVLLNKNRTWGLFSKAKAPAGYWLGASIMGVVCFASFMVYGSGATALGGVLGAIVGWPLFMSMALITSNVLGAVGGEWKGAPKKAHSYSILGIGLLIIAIVVISLGRT
jgi:L-rhamnose-H+ transport protein